MPTAFDPPGRHAVADKDPLRNLLDFNNIDLTAERAGQSIRDGLVNTISLLTGFDLQWLADAFDGINLDLGPGGIRNWLESLILEGASSAAFPHGFPHGFGTQPRTARFFTALRQLLDYDYDREDFALVDALTALATRLFTTNKFAQLSGGRLLDGQAPQALLDLIETMKRAFNQSGPAAGLGGPLAQALQEAFEVIGGLLQLGQNALDTGITALANVTVAVAQTAAAEVVGGVAMSTLFDGAAQTSIPGLNQFYAPGSVGTWGIDGAGNTIWRNITTTVSSSIALLPTPTTTDNQLVSMTLRSAFDAGGIGAAPYDALVMRSNDDRSRRVEARVYQSSVEVGTVVDGVWTLFQGLGLPGPVQAGEKWDALAGTATNAREFVLKRNDTPVFPTPVIDLSAVSYLGSDYRRVGGASGTGYAGIFPFLSAKHPAQLTALSGADRAI